MATKAGRATLKDLKAGKTLWLVRAGYGKALIGEEGNQDKLNLSWVHEPERLVVTQRPFRTMTDHGPSAVSKPKPDWSFVVREFYPSGDSYELTLDCSIVGIPTDVRPEVDCTFLFVSKKAAMRYYEHVRSVTYAHLFEHPAQWKTTGLRKRVCRSWNGRPMVVGDIPTKGNSHRPWLRLRPTEFLMGGTVMNQSTPDSALEHSMRESAKELSMVYPSGPIKCLSDVHLGVTPKEHFKDMENFFTGFWEQLPTPEARKAHIRDGGVRKLYPGQVIIPGDLMPEQRAQIEKDFVILDEAHIIDPPGKRFVEVEASIQGKPVAKLGFDPAGLTLTKVVIGNGDKITHEWTVSPAEFPPADEQPSPEVLAFADQILNGTKITVQGSPEKLKFDDPEIKKEE
jgi:hypothetical protein